MTIEASLGSSESMIDAATLSRECLPGRVKCVLLPLEFSHPSLTALEYGAALALRAGATLHLLHIFEPTLIVGDAANVRVPRVASEKAPEELERRLAELARKHTSPCLTVTSEVRVGNAVDEILSAAKALDADLIVLSSGRPTFKRFLLGSVANRVVREASCPVLIVKTAEGALEKELEPLVLRKILVPTDLSKHSMDAFEFAGKFALQFGAKITFVHVLPVLNAGGMSAYPAPDTSLMTQNVRRAAERELAEAVGAFAYLEVVEDKVVLLGPLFPELADYAQEEGFDLVICTTHGFSSFRHALLGSAEEMLVRMAPIPVMVVRTPASEE